MQHLDGDGALHELVFGSEDCAHAATGYYAGNFIAVSNHGTDYRLIGKRGEQRAVVRAAGNLLAEFAPARHAGSFRRYNIRTWRRHTRVLDLLKTESTHRV